MSKWSARVRQQQVKAEKGRADEEVIHRMDVDAFDRGKDEEDKEKEKEGYGRGLGHVLHPGGLG